MDATTPEVQKQHRVAYNIKSDQKRRAKRGKKLENSSSIRKQIDYKAVQNGQEIWQNKSKSIIKEENTETTGTKKQPRQSKRMQQETKTPKAELKTSTRQEKQ